MKKYLFLFSILSIVLLFSDICYAASAYGTHMPKERKWIWGLEGSSIMDRDLDNEEGGISTDRYLLTGSYGIFSWLSFDGKIGIGNVDWDRNKEDNLSYSTNFAGAYGFRIRGYENKRYGIKSVIGFQHISVHPDPKNQGGDKHEAIIDEWQGSLVISKDLGRVVPYLGSRYGTVDLIKKLNEHDRKRTKSEENLGLILGLDYWLNEKTRLNLEGMFLDGEELAIGISYDF